MIPCFEVSGSRYEMGYAIGRFFAGPIGKEIVKFEEDLKNEDTKRFVEGLRSKLPLWSAGCYDEIRGRADGAGVSFDAMLLMMTPEYYYGEDGCTTAYMKDKDGKVLFSHNEDNTGFYPDTVALVRYDYGERWVVSLTGATRLGGPCFSWNSDGMVYSTNFIVSNEVDLNNPSRYILIRDIIEAGSMAEALDAITRCPSASPFSFNIVDTKADRIANAEKDVDRVYVKEVFDRYARSNHFVLKHGEVEAGPNSLFRYSKINESVNAMDPETVTAEDLYEALQYQEEAFANCIYKDYAKYESTGNSVTVFNFSYDNAKKLFRLRDYVTGDFMEWRPGEFRPGRLG